MLALRLFHTVDSFHSCQQTKNLPVKSLHVCLFGRLLAIHMTVSLFFYVTFPDYVCKPANRHPTPSPFSQHLAPPDIYLFLYSHENVSSMRAESCLFSSLFHIQCLITYCCLSHSRYSANIYIYIYIYVLNE